MVVWPRRCGQSAREMLGSFGKCFPSLFFKCIFIFCPFSFPSWLVHILSLNSLCLFKQTHTHAHMHAHTCTHARSHMHTCNISLSWQGAVISTTFKGLYFKVSRILPFMPFIMTFYSIYSLTLLDMDTKHSDCSCLAPPPTSFSHTPIHPLSFQESLCTPMRFRVILKPGGFNQGHLCDCGWVCRSPPDPGELTPVCTNDGSGA